MGSTMSCTCPIPSRAYARNSSAMTSGLPRSGDATAEASYTSFRPDPPVERKANRPMLRLVPSGAEAKDQAPPADPIHGRSQLRQHGGIVEAGAGHKGPDRDSARDRGNPGQLRPRLPRATGAVGLIAIQEMIPHPDRVEAQLLPEASHRREFGPPNVPLHFRKLEPDLERPRGTKPA